MSTIEMYNFGEVKQITLQLLKDYEAHNIDEILTYVNSKIAPREISKSHMYTSISQLCNHGIPIDKVDSGIYCLRKDESKIINDAKNFLTEQLNACMDYLQKNLNFDLSTSEYCYLKELNEKLKSFNDEITQFGGCLYDKEKRKSTKSSNEGKDAGLSENNEPRRKM